MTTREQLLHNVCLLLSSRTREIVKASLGFIKVILFIMDAKTLASHVTVMVGINIIDDLVCDEDITVSLFNTDLTLWLVFRLRALGASKTT